MSLDIPGICRIGVEKHASDIHLTVESPPAFRINGELKRLEWPPLSPLDTLEALSSICPQDKLETFRQTGQADFPYSVAGTGRFRVNAFRQRGSVAMAMRILAFEVPQISALGLPDAVAELALRRHGLVLISGTTGSGKSTTLSALVNYINETVSCHIVTLEDPIEFLHKHKQSLVNQREVGSDTVSFAQGVRAALREDPDVIVIGELRGLDTVTAAMSAAETGHLVLATTHAARAPQAVTRIADVFPLDHRGQAYRQLSGVLEGVVTQQLLKRVDKPGRVVACEVLLATSEVRSAIRDVRIQDLHDVIAAGENAGMLSMDKSLDELCRLQVISLDDYRSRKL